MQRKYILASAVAEVMAQIPAEPIERDEEQQLERIRKHFYSAPLEKPAPVRQARKVARLGVKKG